MDESLPALLPFQTKVATGTTPFGLSWSRCLLCPDLEHTPPPRQRVSQLLKPLANGAGPGRRGPRRRPVAQLAGGLGSCVHSRSSCPGRL